MLSSGSDLLTAVTDGTVSTGSKQNSTVSYDEMGNPTRYFGAAMTWTGKQLKYWGKSGKYVNFAYNEDGIRTLKNSNGVVTNYYYNGSLLIGMTVGSGSSAKILRFSYDASGNAVAVDYSTDNGSTFNTYYYLRNAQNDIVKLIDNSGSTVVEYCYDSWGKLLSTSGSLASTLGKDNPFRYRGYVYDEETGFYYLQSRYYNPEVGRFISSDVLLSTGQGVIGHNAYAYCLNNPVNMSDGCGHWSQWIKGVADWINNNIIQPVADFFSPNTDTVSGQFQEGIIKGSGSLTGGYSEVNGRLQINSKDSKNNGMLGVFGKVSAGNASGKVGIGNNNVALSLKGVGDGLTATAQAGVQYENGAGLAAKAKAAVLSGRATAELELFGWQIEFGVSGDLLSVGAEAMIGVFPDDGFTVKASVGAGILGGGFIFRVKPA